MKRLSRCFMMCEIINTKRNYQRLSFFLFITVYYLALHLGFCQLCVCVCVCVCVFVCVGVCWLVWGVVLCRSTLPGLSRVCVSLVCVVWCLCLCVCVSERVCVCLGACVCVSGRVYTMQVFLCNSRFSQTLLNLCETPRS